MRIGVPSEVKNHEYRVAITPAGVNEFIVDAPGPEHFAVLERVATDVVPRHRAGR